MMLRSPFAGWLRQPGDWAVSSGRRWGHDVGTWLFYGVAAGAAAMAGLVSAAGDVVYVLIFAGLVVGAMVVASQQALTWFVIVGGLVFSGLAQLYVPGARYARYVVPVAAVMLLLHAAVDRLSNPQSGGGNRRLTEFGTWATLFFLIAVASSFINAQGVGVSLNGLRGYFQMWPFLLALLLIRWAPDDLRGWPAGLMVIGLLQIPFVIHQYLVLVPRRIGLGEGIVPVDIIVGTFGGDIYGGGANAVLAAFMILLTAGVAGLWKHRAISTFTALLLAAIFLSPVFINEAKISAVYLPLVFIVIFYRDMLARPLRFLAATLVMAGILAGLLTALTVTHSSGQLETWSDLVSWTYERQTASIEERRGQFSELSRWTTLTFWAEEHRDANLANILLGHGPGASRVQEQGYDQAMSLAELRYGGLKIGHTAIGAMLWDVGVLGLATVLLMFYAAFRSAGWLVRHYEDRDPARAGLYDGLRAGIAVLTLSLAHKDFFVVNLPCQTLILMVFGYVIVSRKLAEHDRETV